MTKAVAPPKNTAGDGFVFEDKVCAWFFAHMLVDEAPLGHRLGQLARIDFQTRPDGWFLDDILLTLEYDGEQHRCALSIKSNTQFGIATVPPDFVRTAWEQFLCEGSNSFRQNSDYLGLVTCPQSRKIREGMAFVIRTASDGDPALLPNRYAKPGWTSQVRQSLFKSLACPEDLAQRHGMTDVDVARLAARLQFLEFDFELPVSESEKGALDRCRRALQSQGSEESANLWDSLLRLASKLRPVAGYLTRRTLVDQLRRRFRLAIAPDHRTDWQRLDSLSAGALARVRDTIGGHILISRDEDLREIEEAFETSAAVVLVGPSGVGKSAVAKQQAKLHAAAGERYLWFDAHSFDRVDFAQFKADLQLINNLEDVLQSVPDSSLLLVLDGLDRLYDEQAFGIIATLVSSLQIDRGDSPWRILITCQTQEWHRLQDNLLRNGLSLGTWTLLECKPVAFDALEPVWQHVPSAQGLRYQENLRPLLVNLKVLDLIASRLMAGTKVTTSGWVGESSIARWFWEAIITEGRDGSSRARFVTLLAQRQADELRLGIPMYSFQDSESRLLNGLVRDRICQTTEDDKVAFEHDLFGDWARTRILASQSDELEDFLSRHLDSPLWHRALRLYGVYLLEQIGDLDRWRRLVSSLSKNADSSGSDLLLEALFFAADPFTLLEQVRADLLAGDGRLLRRLLGRFLMFATVPDEVMVAMLTGDDNNKARLAATYRQPSWIHWPPVLRFLHGHRDESVAIAPIEIARIVQLWFDYTPRNTMFRREAAELGLVVGERALKAYRDFNRNDSANRIAYYSAALSGAQELPEQVAAYALRASNRTTRSAGTVNFSTDFEHFPLGTRPDPQFNLDELRVPPWPDGPYERIDDQFREVVLDSGALMPLFRMRPEIAREVVLATLIEEPQQFEFSDDWYSRDQLNLEDDRHWQPPLYIHGPFLGFLLINFNEGLETIARLVDFASQRWRSYMETDARKRETEVREHGVKTLSADVGMEPWRQLHRSAIVPPDLEDWDLIGNDQVYGWSAGLANPPSAVTVALMALEQYFYMELNEGRSVEDKVRLVLNRCRSVAFLKVLCDVGKRETSLFQGALRPLLAIPEIYLWDVRTSLKGRHHLMIGDFMHGQWFIRRAQAFHEMEHRSADLREIALRLLFADNDMRDFLTEARLGWEQRLTTTPEEQSQAFLQQLIVGFNIENYELREHPEHGHLIFNVRAQELHAQRADEMREFEEQSFLMLLPIRCRQMIDSGTKLSDYELTELWEQVQRIALQRDKQAALVDNDVELLREAQQVKDRDSVANALTGAAALFVRIHRDWLAEQPEREQWCRAQLKAAVLDPPLPEPMDSPESAASWTYDCFAAEAVPVLWTEERDDVELRHLIANLVLARHYLAVEILFNRCAEHRAMLGTDFDRLRRLLFEWAYIRRRISFVQQTYNRLPVLSRDELERFNESVIGWAEDSISAFVTGDLPLPSESWFAMDLSECFSEIDSRQRRRYGKYAVDFRLVRAAHQWLPTLDQISSPKDRHIWLQFWREALSRALSQVVEGSERNNFPSDDDRWVLEGVAAALPFMIPAESPEAFWQPILDLPSKAYHWPANFLASYHRAGLQQDPISPSFASLRACIIEYVMKRSKEMEVSGQQPYHQEIWEALVGVDMWTRDLWLARHGVLVEQGRDVLEQWFETCKSFKDVVVAFALWLKRPAADSVRLQALTWMDRAITSWRGGRTSQHDQVLEALASLLHIVWLSDESELRRNSEAFAAFQRILRWLTNQQNPLAMELVRVMGHL